MSEIVVPYNQEWIVTNVPSSIATFETIEPEGYSNLTFTDEVTHVVFKVIITPTQEFDDWAKSYGLDYSMTVTSKEGLCVILPSKEAAMWFKMRWM